MPMIQTTSFKIAQYILMFLVAALCVGIIVWVISAQNTQNTLNATSDNVIRVNNNTSPCIQNVNNKIAQMWAYNPDAIPEKYLAIANEYPNEKITTKIDGTCNNTKFTCRPGQMRRDCDPCAAGTARQIAMDQHITDTIAQECK